MISEESEDGYYRLRDDVDGKLVFVDRELLDEFGKACGEILAIMVERGLKTGGPLGWIDTGWLAKGCGGRFS